MELDINVVISNCNITCNQSLPNSTRDLCGNIGRNDPFMCMPSIKSKKIPIIYLWVHHKILEQRQTVMKRKCLIETIRRCIRLPPNLYSKEIITELEAYGLLQHLNKKRGYRILQERFLVEDPFF